MGVFQRGATWVFEFQLHGHRVKRGGFPTEEIAKQAETIARARIIDVRLEREYGIRPPRGRIPMLRAYITDTYLPDIQGRLSPTTYHSHKRLLTTMADHLGMHRVSDVTTAMLSAYRNERATGLKANSLRLEFARIRQFFRHVVKAGHLHASPAADVGDRSIQSSIASSSARPASRRRSWTARCRSRASPSARSSSVRVVSIATTSPSS